MSCASSCFRSVISRAMKTTLSRVKHEGEIGDRAEQEPVLVGRGRSADPSRLRLVTSERKPTAPTISPAAFRIGAVEMLTSIERAVAPAAASQRIARERRRRMGMASFGRRET
jgi:hypothetical protein